MKTICLKYCLLSFLLMCSLRIYAQSDYGKTPSQTLVKINSVCMDFLGKENWDSGLYYSNKLLAQSDLEFGRMSDHSAIALYQIGEIKRIMEKYREALPYLIESEEIYSKLDPQQSNQVIRTLVLERLGYVYNYLGASNKAEEFYNRQITLAKTRQQPESNFLEVYSLLAGLKIKKGDYMAADSLYMLSSTILDTLNKSGFLFYQKASMLGNLASIYSETGNNIKAIQLLKQAIPVEKEARLNGYITGDYSILCLNLAEAYATDGNTDSAWVACKQAEDSIVDDNKNFVTALIVKQKAFIYQQEKKYEKAIVFTRLFLHIYDSLSLGQIDNDYYAALVNLGTLYTAIKEYKLADSIYTTASQNLQQAGLTYSYAFLHAKKGLCISMMQQEKYDEAADSLLSLIQQNFRALNQNFTGMSEADKLQYQNDADKSFDLLYICMHNSKNISQATINKIFRVELQRKGFVLRSQLKEINAIRNTKDTSVIHLYDDWLNNNQMLCRQYSLPFNQRVFNIDSLENVSAYLQKKLTTFSKLAHKNESLLPASVQPATFTANIQFLRYNYASYSTNKDSSFYAAFINTSTDTIAHFIDLCSEQQLLGLMKDKAGEWIDNNQLTQNLYNQKSAYSKKLYNLIWKRPEKYLAGIKFINYSPASLLNNISFPAIYDGKNYLINKYSFNRYYNLSQSFTAGTTTAMPSQLNIWGSINYNTSSYADDKLLNDNKDSFSFKDFNTGSFVKDMSHQPLQAFNTDEIINIKKLFSETSTQVNSVENAQATEDFFKEQSGTLSGVVHISTHGFYMPFNKSSIKSSAPSEFISGTANPLFRCGLAFAGANYYWLKGKPRNNHDDGILTGYEVAQLDLHNVDLLTLSACETGLGDITNNEGDLGLQRAFKIAGVQNMLVSLWQVPAKQTSELLTLFYNFWLKGMQPAQALRQAEITMQKEYPPYFWAGFVLIQ